MKSWLALTVARLLVVAVISILAIWLMIWRPANDAHHTITQQKNLYVQASSSTQEASSLIGGLPDIEGIGLRQPGNFASYSNDCIYRNNKIAKISVEQRQPHKILALDHQKIVHDVNSNLGQSNVNALASAQAAVNHGKELLTYHCKIMTALVNILEYDPTRDMQGFQSGSEDANKRLQLAQKGLDKAAASLSSQKGNHQDAGFLALQQQISLIQSARNRLAQDGNTEAWIDNFVQSQVVIAGNRQLFWRKNLDNVHMELHQAEERLAKRITTWSNIANKYNDTLE